MGPLNIGPGPQKSRAHPMAHDRFSGMVNFLSAGDTPCPRRSREFQVSGVGEPQSGIRRIRCKAVLPAELEIVHTDRILGHCVESFDEWANGRRASES